MIPKVKSVIPLPDYKLAVAFRDGASGVVDIGKTLNLRGILAKLNNLEFFARVYVGRNSKTVTWPGQIDLDPVMLYHRATGRSLEWILDQPDSHKPGRAKSASAAIRSGQPNE